MYKHSYAHTVFLFTENNSVVHNKVVKSTYSEVDCMGSNPDSAILIAMSLYTLILSSMKWV